MAVNIKATYKNIPHQTIGPFTATLEYFESSGITVSGISVNTVQITSGTTSGMVETLNIGPSYKILKDDLTHQQLINGFTFNQIKCGDTFIRFQSTEVCFSSYQADLVGANGYPTVRLTINNDANINIKSTLTITPDENESLPVPSTITVLSTSAGQEFAEIYLGKGRYDFYFTITSNSPSINRYATLEFFECGGI